MSAIEEQVDAAVESTPGVAAVYEVARPLGGLLALARGSSNSTVRGVGALAEVTVCIGLSPEADAAVVGQSIGRSIRVIDGLAESRIHIRIARIHFEDASILV